MTKPYSILIAAIGSRGDVQPFLALAAGLVKLHRPGTFRIMLGAHLEYQTFVEKHSPDPITKYFPIEPTLEHINDTINGKQLELSPFSKMSLAREAFKDVCLGWTKSIHSVLMSHGPFDLVVLPVFGIYFPVLALIKSLPIETRPRVLLLQTMPTYPTSDFSPPIAGIGTGFPFGFLNSLSWKLVNGLLNSFLLTPVASEICRTLGIPMWPTSGDVTSALADENDWSIGYVYSNAYLPRPTSWPANHQVLGFLDYTPPQENKQESQLPDDLTTFLERAGSNPVVYVGLGSMLYIAFESPEEALSIVQRLYDGLVQSVISAETLGSSSLFAVLYTASHPNGSHITPQLSNDRLATNIHILQSPVSHAKLFPKCTLTVHHGGAGTLHTSLLHGCPSIIYACLKVSDQPFWGSVTERNACGIYGGMVQYITPESVARTVLDGVARSEEMRANVACIRDAMLQDKPVQWINDWIGPIGDE